VKWSDVVWTGVTYVKWFCFKVKWNEVVWTDVIYMKWFCFQVKWSVVMWSELAWFMWSDFVLKWSEVKWSEAKWSEVLGDKSTTYIRVTLYWGYLTVLWLFYLVCILYCGCFNLFCNVWVLWQLCGCFGNVCTCIYCVFVFFRLCIFIVICY